MTSSTNEALAYAGHHMPDLTICITTYNRWDKCELSVRAALDQEDVSFEIVLVDDASTEVMPSTLKLLLAANEIRLLRHPTNLGLAHARNSGIANAQGRYFAFCDDDDTWPPFMGRALTVAMRQSHSGVRMCIGIPRRSARWATEVLGARPTLTDLFFAGVTPPVSSQIYDIKLLKHIGGYNGDIKSGVDHDLWVSLLNTNPYVNCVPGCTASVGKGGIGSRMTTNERKRKSGIAKALDQWRPPLQSVLGKEFYEHFRNCYMQHIELSLLLSELRARLLFSAALRIINSPRLTRQLAILLLRKSSIIRTGNMFPKFPRPQQNPSE